MAGSYRHIVNNDNELIDNNEFIDMIENLGDAYEMAQECWWLINILAGFNKDKIAEAHEEYLRQEVGKVNKYGKAENYWE